MREDLAQCLCILTLNAEVSILIRSRTQAHNELNMTSIFFSPDEQAGSAATGGMPLYYSLALSGLSNVVDEIIK